MCSTYLNQASLQGAIVPVYHFGSDEIFDSTETLTREPTQLADA